MPYSFTVEKISYAVLFAVLGFLGFAYLLTVLHEVWFKFKVKREKRKYERSL